MIKTKLKRSPTKKKRQRKFQKMMMMILIHLQKKRKMQRLRRLSKPDGRKLLRLLSLSGKK